MCISAKKNNTIPVENSNSNSLNSYDKTAKPFGVHRNQADGVQEIYAGFDEYQKYSERVSKCAHFLSFAYSEHNDDKKPLLKLFRAYFCKVRLCPMCQWRRCLMWQSKFFEVLPQIEVSNPTARWLFLTLTVRNCDITDLSNTLTNMNLAWHKFIKRKELEHIIGWVRTTEVTRGNDGNAHPHFHIMLLVPPSMFNRNYIKIERWAELWQESGQFEYIPQINIQAVKSRKPKEGISKEEYMQLALKQAIVETLKYSTKPADMLIDKEWFFELTKQTYKKRFIAAGGILKDIMKSVEIEEDSSEKASVENETMALLNFKWEKPIKSYQKID
jgi:plasmid rolling circle replication initiator protein Rep